MALWGPTVKACLDDPASARAVVDILDRLNLTSATRRTEWNKLYSAAVNVCVCASLEEASQVLLQTQHLKRRMVQVVAHRMNTSLDVHSRLLYLELTGRMEQDGTQVELGDGEKVDLRPIVSLIRSTLGGPSHFARLGLLASALSSERAFLPASPQMEEMFAFTEVTTTRVFRAVDRLLNTSLVFHGHLERSSEEAEERHRRVLEAARASMLDAVRLTLTLTLTLTQARASMLDAVRLANRSTALGWHLSLTARLLCAYAQLCEHGAPPPAVELQSLFLELMSRVASESVSALDGESDESDESDAFELSRRTLHVAIWMSRSLNPNPNPNPRSSHDVSYTWPSG